MYEERRETISIKDIIIQGVLIIFVIILLFGIFSKNGFIRKIFKKKETKPEITMIEVSSYDLDNLAIKYDRMFADNLYRMKQTALNYYNNERLPKETDASDKMTLNEMYEKHLISSLKNKDGKECDGEKSYVLITKEDKGYKLKVNLSCNDIEDYVVVDLDNYEYCEKDSICEKQKDSSNLNNSKDKDNNKDKESNKDKDSNKDKENNKDKDDKDKIYLCEYSKDIGGFYGNYGKWSKWSTEKVTSNYFTYVETKKKKEIVGYTEDKQIVGTKTEKYVKDVKEEKYVVKTVNEKKIVGYKDEKVITDYKNEKIIIDYTTEKVKVGTTTKTYYKKVPSRTMNVYQKTDSGTTVPKDTKEFVYVKTNSKVNNGTTIYTWDVYKIVTVYKAEKVTEEVPVYEEKKVPVYGTKKTPIYETKKVPVYETVKKDVYGVRKVEVYDTREVPEYKEVKVPVYDDVTYYRYKERNYFGGSSDTKWSTCDPKDDKLIEEGFILTGNKKES